MAMCGRPGGCRAKERKPEKVGSTEQWEGGSWIVTIKGGCGAIVKLSKSERKTSQPPRR